MPPRRNPYQRDDDGLIDFTGAASSADVVKPGPKPNPESLTQQHERGLVTHLHVLIPRELHRAVKVRAAATDRNVSELVTAALRAYLEG